MIGRALSAKAAGWVRRDLARLRAVGVCLTVGCLAAVLSGAGFGRSARPRDWRDLHSVAAIPSSGFFTDGERYAVFELPDSPPGVRPVQIFDTRANRTVRTIRTGCSPEEAGGGYALLVCPDPSADPSSDLSTRPVIVQVLRLATGRVVALPGRFPMTREYDSVQFLGIGSHWIEAEECYLGRFCGTLYVNWRTGQLRNRDDGRDLNSEELRRQPRARTRVFVRRDSLWLRRPGRRVLRLGHCDNRSCGSVSLVAGRVTWEDGSTVRGYWICRARFYAHRFRFGPFVRHTRYRLLALVEGPKPGRYRLYTGAW